MDMPCEVFYHQLVMEFALHILLIWISAPPIYTSLSLTGNGMSTVKDVYALIVADMTKAVDGLTTSRLGKSYINKSVANGILAQVYQVMGSGLVLKMQRTLLTEVIQLQC
jgi:hypothetical protein